MEFSPLIFAFALPALAGSCHLGFTLSDWLAKKPFYFVPVVPVDNKLKSITAPIDQLAPYSLGIHKTTSFWPTYMGIHMTHSIGLIATSGLYAYLQYSGLFTNPIRISFAALHFVYFLISMKFFFKGPTSIMGLSLLAQFADYYLNS